MMNSFNTIITRCYNRYVSQDDQALLKLVFKNNPTQKDIDDFLNIVDIEVMDGNRCLLLSYLLHEHPTLSLSDYAEPRIKGLMRFFHFKNVKTLAHFSKIGNALNKNKIPFVLFKGGAIKAMRPNLSRPMGDIDILLPEGKIQEAVKICELLGYQHEHGKPTHAVGMHTENEDAVDLHYLLFDEGRDMQTLQKNIFLRATKHYAYGVEFFLPCPEDLFFLVLTNFTKNLHDQTTLGGIYYALCDCNFLLRVKNNFSFDIVREDAELGKKELEIRFAAELMNKIIPEIIPNLDKNLPFLNRVNEFCNLLIFDEKFYTPLRQKCQAIRVAELRNFPVKNGKKILTFLLFDKLRHFPAFISWYLKQYNKKG